VALEPHSTSYTASRDTSAPTTGSNTVSTLSALAPTPMFSNE